MKTKTVTMFCEGCGDDRRFARTQHEQSICVRGEEIAVMEPVLVCPRCGAVQPDLSDGVDSLKLAYEQYRHRHGLLSPERIAEIRTQYGLSHEAFAAVLGMSPTTLFRYERGALQDAMPDSMIYACDDPRTMERLVERNPKVLSDLQLRRFREALVQITARRGAKVMAEICASDADPMITGRTEASADLSATMSVQAAMSIAVETHMTMVARETQFTPDDLLRLEDQGLYELVGGKLVEKRTSALASETAGIITMFLVAFAREARVGKVYPEQTFRCFPSDEGLIRRPDIAFIATDRLPGVAEEGHVRIAPDLAVEVVSPNDTFYEEDKIDDYRAAGVKLIWVVNPKRRSMRVYRADHSDPDLRESDTVTGEAILPGFSVRVGEFLPAANG